MVSNYVLTDQWLSSTCQVYGWWLNSLVLINPSGKNPSSPLFLVIRPIVSQRVSRRVVSKSKKLLLYGRDHYVIYSMHVSDGIKIAKTTKSWPVGILWDIWYFRSLVVCVVTIAEMNFFTRGTTGWFPLAFHIKCDACVIWNNHIRFASKLFPYCCWYSRVSPRQVI